MPTQFPSSALYNYGMNYTRPSNRTGFTLVHRFCCLFILLNTPCMNNKKNMDHSPKKESSTDKSIKTGKKAIQAERQINGKPANSGKSEKKDAEKWRNEG